MLAFVLAVIGGVVGEELAIVLTGAHADAKGNIPVTAPILVGVVVGQYGVWLAWMALVSHRKGTGSLHLDFGFFVDPARDWWLVFAGSGFALLAGLLLAPLSSLDKGKSQDVVDQLTSSHGAKRAVLILTAIVVAPAIEELFFRGLLLRSLLRRFSSPVAVVIAAVCFAFVHFAIDPSIAQIAVQPALVALGVLSGYFAVRTGNLSRSVLLHAGFNLLAVVTGVAILTIR